MASYRTFLPYVRHHISGHLAIVEEVALLGGFRHIPKGLSQGSLAQSVPSLEVLALSVGVDVPVHGQNKMHKNSDQYYFLNVGVPNNFGN